MMFCGRLADEHTAGERLIHSTSVEQLFFLQIFRVAISLMEIIIAKQETESVPCISC